MTFLQMKYILNKSKTGLTTESFDERVRLNITKYEPGLYKLD